jgi:hypothetical protein
VSGVRAFGNPPLGTKSDAGGGAHHWKWQTKAENAGRLTPAFGNRQSVRRKNNDPGPLNVLVRVVALADHRRQARAIFGPRDQQISLAVAADSHSFL